MEEDENFLELQEEKYQNEFIFKVFQFITLGGGCCQFERDVSEYLQATKDLYKDLICVAKDEETNEIKPMSYVFKIEQVTHSLSSSKDLYRDDHP